MLAHPVMKQQMATLSSILENFPMPFFLVDPFLVVTHINDAWRDSPATPAAKWWAG